MSSGAWQSGGSGLESYTPRGSGSMGRWIRRFVVWGFIVLVAGAWWITRDTYPRWRVVSDRPAFTAVIAQPVDNRARIAGSGIWQAFPPGWDSAPITAPLTADYGVPDWVLRHVLGSKGFVSSENGVALDDVVVVTRMSRIGCLVERIGSRVLGRIDRDWAGGLALRHVEDAELYYAVRGRTLVMSHSRPALIRALTLPEDESMDAEVFHAELSEGGSEDIRGTAIFTAGDPWGDVIRSLGFAARIDTYETTAKFNVVFQPEWASRLQPLLRNAQPGPLPEPLPGMLDVRLNAGLAPEELAAAVERAMYPSRNDTMWWADWNDAPDADDSPLPYFLTSLLSGCGPSATVTVVGADLNEMIPVPEVVAVVERRDSAWPVNMDRLAGMPGPAGEALLRQDETTGVVSVSMPGGPSLEPSAAPRRNELLLSNSRPVIENLAKQGPKPSANEAVTGNLAISLRPLECVQVLVEGGMLFAEIGAIRGHTAESFRMAGSEWLQWGARVGEIRAVASRNEGGISIDTRIVLNQ